NDGASDLEFAHGELGLYTSVIEDLLAAFRCAYPKAQVRVSSMSDADTDLALREGHIDVASVFIAQWPVAGFDALRLVDCATTGAIVSRPFDEPPIPCWIALVWRPNAPRLVQHLVDVARTLGGAMQDPRGTRIA